MDLTGITANIPKPIIVSLKQVAAWDLEHLNAPCKEIKASVPALQRGLVWSPHQVELLWDSILRGFPIGSFVVSKKNEKQERSRKADITHHLLDGQQRTNAITLGFHDPFSEISGEVRNNKSASILWLDIAPQGTVEFPNSHLMPNSTREFLTRVTTLAHPWGYKSDDNAGRLSAGDARESVEWEFENKEQPKDKPSSLDLLPWQSNAPVPLSWLMAAVDDGNGRPKDELSFWCAVSSRLELEATKRKWPSLALNFLKQENIASRLHDIYWGISRALQTQVVVIEAPQDILSASRQEKSVNNEVTANIASIEHLFNRLNRQGTSLDGEELAYSMIKAYWPEIADVIDSVKTRRIPPSHLVSLGVRAAITDSKSGKVARAITIPRLRAIAKSAPPNNGELDSPTYQQRNKIEEFIGKQEGGDVATERNRLAKACAKVDKWLVYDSKLSPNGLPPVLLSSFARASSDVYLFLLYIADRLGITNPDQDIQWQELLPGIATLVHWFTKEDKLAISDLLLASVAAGISPENVRKGLAAAFDQQLIFTPCYPDELDEFIKLPADDQSLMKWQWWQSLVETAPEPEREHRLQNLWPTIERTRNQRELLLYGQRSYLNIRFPDYDPSRKDLWENHNRPWDFDHIHAGFYFSGKQGVYADFCRQWGGIIGNLRAWPFQENRSDQDKKANEKLSGNPDEIKWSLIESEAELDSFSHGHNTRHEPSVAARALSAAIKARYVRIYRDWFDSTGIASLLPPRATIIEKTGSTQSVP